MIAFTELNALCIEDNHTMLKVIANILKKLGFRRVFPCKDGYEGLRILADEEIDLVVTDWVMPNMDGIELVHTVRSSTERFKNVPIIMITSNGDRDSILQAAQIGINSYIVKPFSMQVVENKIIDVLKLKQHNKLHNSAAAPSL